MDNVLNNINDTLTVVISPKISGKIIINNFVESLSGLTTSRNVNREFRITTDGIFWSDWKELSPENLSIKEYIVDNSLTIEVKYTRIGVDSTGSIIFNDISFTGAHEEIQFIAPTISDSIFADIIGTSNMKLLEKNLFKKLYYRGILPNYITRAENSDPDEDKDFIDLFYSLSQFYSMIVCFFDRFENFKNDLDLLREQIRQYGIYFNESTITLDELQYLAQHIYDQIRQRGTDLIFARKGDILKNSGKTVEIDGEYIRLLRSKKSDELLYESIPLYKTGWCLGQCSPLYRGTAQSYNLNKIGSNDKDISSLNDYYVSSSGSYDIYKTSENKKVFRIRQRQSAPVAIGRIDDSYVKPDKLITVDSRMDYEITFLFQSTLPGTSDNLTFGVEGFDILKNKLTDSFITPNGDFISEIFINQLNINSNFKKEVWYQFRGIIHAYGTRNVEKSETNIGRGTNLYFNNSFVKYLYPKIIIRGTGESYIWDVKMRPLVRGTNIIPLKNGTENSFSMGFIQSNKIFFNYARNNNNSQSKTEITNIIEKYLLPYDLTSIFVFLSNY